MSARDPVAVNLERYHGWHQDLHGRWIHQRLAPDGVNTLQQALDVQRSADRTAAQAARDNNIRRADTDDEYREQALVAIRRVAERCTEFTTDAVLDEDPRLAGTRSLGPAMLHAAREGWIVSTDRMGSSSTRASHARMKRVWRSLVIGGQPGATVPTMALAEVVSNG